MSDSKFILGRDILISINDIPLAMVESIETDSQLSYRHISSAFEAYDNLCLETEAHNIAITRLKLDSETGDIFSSYKDSTFTLKADLPEYSITFSDCRLLSLKESCNNNGRIIEKMQILSYSREITQS